MIEIPMSKHFSGNKARCRGDHTPCAVCGQGIAKPWRHAVHVHEGGGRLVQEAEAEGLSEGADLGFWPIGADCLARHKALRPYAYAWNEGDIAPAFPEEHDAEAARLARGEGALVPVFPKRAV